MQANVSESPGRRITARLLIATMTCIFALMILTASVQFFAPIRLSPWVELVSMQRILLCVGSVVTLGCVIALVAIRQDVRWSRRSWPALVWLVIGALTVGAVFVPRHVDPPRTATEPDSRISILSWNTNQDGAAVEDIERLVASRNPDFVVLPEMFGTVAENQLSSLLSDGRYTLLSWDGSSASLLVSKALGEYEMSSDGVPAWAGFVARPTNSADDSPTLVVTHVEHIQPFRSGTWNDHLHWLERECNDENVVAVGDFNATAESLASGTLGGCTDVAVQLGATSGGTWPTALPAALGAQIDRAMVSRGWRGVSFEVDHTVDSSGSDHRPIFVELERVAG